MHLTLQQLVRAFDAATFARGQAYCRQGNVISLRRDAGRIEGEVRGSGRQLYRQVIKFVAQAQGIEIKGACSCPMSHNCKHVVALLLASLDAEGAVPAALPSAFAALPATAPATAHPAQLPPQTELWLSRMARAQASIGREAVPPRGAQYRLAFVLIPERFGHAPSLYLCKLHVLKDGRIGNATIQNDIYRLLGSAPAYIRAEDEEAIRLVAALGIGNAYLDRIKPEGRLGARLLVQLCDEGRLLWAATRRALQSGELVQVRSGPSRRALLGWHADEDDDETVGLRWHCDDGSAIGQVFATTPLLYLEQGVLGELVPPETLAAMTPGALLSLVEEAPRLLPEQRAAMATRLVEGGLDRLLPLPQGLQTRRRCDIAPTPRLLLDSEATIARGECCWHDYARLSFDYGGMSTEGVDEPVLRRVLGTEVELIERDFHAEEHAADTLAEIGFRAAAASYPLWNVPGALQLPGESDWIRFARDALPRLRAAGWQIDIGGSYRYDLTEPQDWYAELEEEGEGGSPWFSLELGILVNGQRHSLLPLLLQMIRSAPRDFDAAALAARGDDSDIVVDLPGGLRVALPWLRIQPLLATLSELYLNERAGSALRLPLTDAVRLAELEGAAQLRWLGGERLRELGRKLQHFDGIRQVALPRGLQAQLRAYQHAGLSWMQFLREYEFGGILADDMGLGKTVQTIAHILVEKEAGRLDAPALVVAPTSLMANWQAETARFAPGLRVLLLHGKDRAALFDEVAGADLVLTTYALLGRDEEALRRHRYHLLILDEAQYIKNSRARAAQVARLLDARHRLCLTGTPVQNHLGELWSQFHFLMPGLLGEEKAFKAFFRKPIEQHGDSARKDLLIRRVKPFMLRRTKDKVATELPPKTEIVLPIELGGAQRDLYETVRLAMDRKVRDEIDRKGLARSQIVILDALLKLRQVCCDPRLLRPASEAGSAKLDALMDLLETLLSEGRKVLVFSQFTSMLALIADALRLRSLAFVTLTGDTTDRAAPVTAFQQGQVGVFLISLKAGGVGLNLTAADTVIHYDPWWNPASENQATDRAWRIGQEQAVFVYKLIARGTLEEKIQDMQRRKGELANAVLTSEGGAMPGIGAADLHEIFALSDA